MITHKFRRQLDCRRSPAVQLRANGDLWVITSVDFDIITPALTVQQGWVVVNVDYRLTSDQVLLASIHRTISGRKSLVMSPACCSKAPISQTELTLVRGCPRWSSPPAP